MGSEYQFSRIDHCQFAGGRTQGLDFWDIRLRSYTRDIRNGGGCPTDDPINALDDKAGSSVANSQRTCFVIPPETTGAVNALGESAAEALAACKKRCRGLTKWLCDGINVVPLEAPELLLFTNTSVNDRGIPWGKGGASFHSHQQLGWLLSCPSFPPHAHTKLTLAPHTHIRAVTSPHIIPVGCLPRATRKTAMRTASSTSSRRSELIHLSATRSKRQAFASLRRTGRWLRRTCTTKCGTRRATYSSRCASSLASPQRCALHPRPPCPRTRCATT